MPYLFHHRIDGPSSWGAVYQSKEAFAPLLCAILGKERLPAAEIRNAVPGTHAVFRAGDLVVKVYAPREAGFGEDDYACESFGLRHAHARGVRVSEPMACGQMEDRYPFDYLITRYVPGEPFDRAAEGMDGYARYAFGRKLREACDRMNVPVEPFSRIDTRLSAFSCRRWDCFPAAFRREREDWIREADFSSLVFVHGDLCGDNLLLSGPDVYVIDFGDSRRAMKAYEYGVVACELFRMRRPFMEGFFGEYSASEMADLCLKGLLPHEFGSNILHDLFGPEYLFEDLSALRSALIKRAEDDGNRRGGSF